MDAMGAATYRLVAATLAQGWWIGNNSEWRPKKAA
jgi:hypothetical protein